MTKEELEKEAEEWCKKKNLTPSNVGYFTADYCEQAYLAGAEPREKQIQIDAEQIRALQKQNGELTDKVKELEAENSIVWTMIKEKDKQIGEFEKLPRKVKELETQIEKMKCCENCRYCNEWGEANSNSPNCKKCNWVSNWKLRR